MDERNSFYGDMVILKDHITGAIFEGMKYDPEGGGGMGMTELRSDDLVQAAMTVQVQIVCATLKMHREDQAHQSQIMIAVKVADQYVIDSVKICLVAHKLHLGRFPAIDQEVLVLDLQ